jgi:hypothetical protein
VDHDKVRALIREAHEERYFAEQGLARPARAILKNAKKTAMGQQLPRGATQPAQVHWLLATNVLAPIDQVYPIVWEQILRERLSGLPVAQR